jgi:predicted nucleic acid-binding protein
MATTYTVDASVFLNGFNPYESGHEQSRRFLDLLREQGVPIIVPTLLLPEVAAAVSRGRGDRTAPTAWE